MENELNKWIHEFLEKGCWHEYADDDDFKWNGWRYKCSHCGKDFDTTEDLHAEAPDYTFSLDLASLAEAKAIEVVGWELYLGMLEIEMYAEWRRNGRPQPKPTKLENLRQLITATALQRCTAVRAAVEGK